MAIPALSWSSPKRIPDMDGALLSVILRVRNTGKTWARRTIMDPPSVLQKDNVPFIVGTFAYVRSRIRQENVTSREQLIERIAVWKDVEIKEWCQNNQEEVEVAMKELMELAYDPDTKQGFSCYG